MRTTLLFLLLGLVMPGRSQSWCPPGAEWSFDYSLLDQSTWTLYLGTEVVRYAGDTVVGGHLTQRLTRATHYTNTVTGEQGVDVGANLHTRYADGVVHAWEPWSMQFDTLLWFDAVPGDRWTVFGSADDYFNLVTDTATVEVSGVPLRRLVVSMIYPAFEPEVVASDTILERIGFTTYSTFTPYFPVADDESRMFRCYRDEGLNFPSENTEACVFNVQVPERSGAIAAAIHPNPGTDRARLLFPGTSSRMQVTVRDARGLLVLDLGLRQHGDDLDLSSLASGLYTVLLLSDSGQRHTLKWIKA